MFKSGNSFLLYLPQCWFDYVVKDVIRKTFMIKWETQIYSTICVLFLNGRYLLSYLGLDGIIILKRARNNKG